ncbi:uncharacterized protein PFB0145c-like [Echeneis naucrates]|uniref:uncharacterized protein PFB0145c-like n=1 Tax=Echeneis naucrates TaxID=173247 RepID=UPI0011133E3F|nr:uncharacterized protein PFB0145c-like [Echeneis naucrates]
MQKHQVMNKMQVIKSLREKLLHVNERMTASIEDKMKSLHQNSKDVLIVSTLLEEKFAELDEQKDNMTYFTELFEREKESLKSLQSKMVNKRKDMEKQWKQACASEKLHLDKLKADLKNGREDLEREKEMMKKDKMDLELMKSDFLKQRRALEQDKEDFKEQKEKVETTNTELQKQKERADSLYVEIKREKNNIKDLSLQLGREQAQVQDVINTITLKLKEEKMKDSQMRRKSEQLEIQKNSLLAERERLEDLRKDLKMRREELAAALNSISGEKENLLQIKVSLDMDKDQLESDKDKVKAEMYELKLRGDELTGKLQYVQTLRSQLKELNERTRGAMKTKLHQLDQKSQDVKRLRLAVEKQLADLNVQTSQIQVYTELMQKEQRNLTGILSKMVMKPDDMGDQWEHRFEMESKISINKGTS